MANDRDGKYEKYTEVHGHGHRSDGARSCSPRRAEFAFSVGDKEKRGRDYVHDIKYRYRSSAGASGSSKRTRWDVGDPERGRKLDRHASRSRNRSRSSYERRAARRHESPLSRRNAEDPRSRRCRSRSSSSSVVSDSSASSRHRSLSHRRHRRSPSSSSSSSSSPSSQSQRSRSRRRKERRKSKDKGKNRKKYRRHKEEKRKGNRSHSPERRSALTGKKIKMKVHKTAEDEARDANREQLLKFLNSAYE